MFTKHKVLFYFVSSWHAAYRLHPKILPDLRNLAKLGHAKLYPTFCLTLYVPHLPDPVSAFKNFEVEVYHSTESTPSENPDILS